MKTVQDAREILQISIQKLIEDFKGRGKEVRESIETLIQKGVPNGCYQDYALVGSLIQILENLGKSVEG